MLSSTRMLKQLELKTVSHKNAVELIEVNQYSPAEAADESFTIPIQENTAPNEDEEDETELTEIGADNILKGIVGVAATIGVAASLAGLSALAVGASKSTVLGATIAGGGGCIAALGIFTCIGKNCKAAQGKKPEATPLIPPTTLSMRAN